MGIEIAIQESVKNPENTKLSKTAQNLSDLNTNVADMDKSLPKEIMEKNGLTDAEKLQVQEETGWSDAIINSLGSMEEYRIYKGAGLNEALVGGRVCLVRSDIDLLRTDALGRTSEERMELGLAPISQDSGDPIELHHIGQHADSPLAELTYEEHYLNGNDGILHDKTKETESDRHAFDKERQDHWRERETMVENKVSHLEKDSLKVSSGVAGLTDHGVDDLDKSVVRALKQKEGLTKLEKLRVKVETGWSNEIIDAIGSMEEFEIYKDAGLKEKDIKGKPCLIRQINFRQKDSLGRTNKERMQEGLAPLDQDSGNPIELHYIGQHANGPLAELTSEEHRMGGHYFTLHDSVKESEMDWEAFNIECEKHWERRYGLEELMGLIVVDRLYEKKGR